MTDDVDLEACRLLWCHVLWQSVKDIIYGSPLIRQDTVSFLQSDRLVLVLKLAGLEDLELGIRQIDPHTLPDLVQQYRADRREQLRLQRLAARAPWERDG